jgi:hypothetical protein
MFRAMADNFVSKAAPTDRSGESLKLPRRILGRTGAAVSILGFGVAPIGISPTDAPVFERMIHEAIDLGVSYIDVAPAYGDGEEKLGPVIRERRDEVFLVTKTLLQEPRNRNEALRQIRNSLRKLQTDYVDVVHLHNVGRFTREEALGPNGGLAALIQAKRDGLLRFIGISGHVKPLNFIEIIETGEVDVVMPALNFVDRHTYDFESKVVPIAQKGNCGVVAMKVLGGVVGMRYHPPQPGLLSDRYYTNAIRYALSLPAVSCAVIGLKNLEELHRAVETVVHFTPLTEAEQAALAIEGKEIAAEWGAHFGPVE